MRRNFTLTSKLFFPVVPRIFPAKFRQKNRIEKKFREMISGKYPRKKI